MTLIADERDEQPEDDHNTSLRMWSTKDPKGKNPLSAQVWTTRKDPKPVKKKRPLKRTRKG